MTDSELRDSLDQARLDLAEQQLQKLLDRGAATMLHASAVMARESWIKTWNSCAGPLKGVTDDAICEEIAASLNALNEMVDRTAALVETNKPNQLKKENN